VSLSKFSQFFVQQLILGFFSVLHISVLLHIFLSESRPLDHVVLPLLYQVLLVISYFFVLLSTLVTRFLTFGFVAC
jgi:hypothetical protein